MQVLTIIAMRERRIAASVVKLKMIRFTHPSVLARNPVTKSIGGITGISETSVSGVFEFSTRTGLDLRNVAVETIVPEELHGAKRKAWH